MKLKRFLASLMTAAMVITSVPVSGLGGIVAQAEEPQASLVIGEKTYNLTQITEGLTGSADAANYGDETVDKALDGNDGTIWSTASADPSVTTRYTNNRIYLKLSSPSTVKKLTYVSKGEDINVNAGQGTGTVNKANVYVSTSDATDKEGLIEDIANWVEPETTTPWDFSISAANPSGTVEFAEAAENVTWVIIEATDIAEGAQITISAKEIKLQDDEDNQISGLTASGDADEASTNPYTNLVDEDDSTQFETSWTDGETQVLNSGVKLLDNNNNYYITLATPANLGRLVYVPRQSQTNGIFLEANIYVSNSADATDAAAVTDWKQVYTTGGTAWANDASEKVANFTEVVEAKYVRVEAKSTPDGTLSAADFKLYSAEEEQEEQVEKTSISYNELGEATLTDEDKSFYEGMSNLTVNMVYKYNNPENKNYALFTLVDTEGNYLTVWSNPNANSTQGRLSYSYNGENVPYWSKTQYHIDDSDYHKITVTINSGITGEVIAINDGARESGLTLSGNYATNYSSALTWLADFEVAQVLVGQPKDANCSVGNTGNLVALDGAVQYVTVTKEAYSTADELMALNNAVSDELKESFTSLTTECAALNEDDYTEASWTEFSTALTAANAVDTDTAKEWTLYTTLEALKTAKEALVVAEKDKEIASATLKLTAPATGIAPANATTTDEGYTVSTTWKTEDGTALESSAVFEAETVYAAEIVLTAAAGYVFADDVTVTLNGDAVTPAENNGTLTVSKTFAATSDKTAIAKPNLSLAAPTVGGTPEDAVDKDAVGTDSGFTLDDCVTLAEKPNLAGNNPFVFTFDINVNGVDSTTDARILGQTGATDSEAWQYNFGAQNGLISVYANASCQYAQNGQANASAWPQADINVSNITADEDGWVSVIVMYTGADADGNVDGKTRLCLYVGDQGNMGRYSAFSIPAAGGDMSFNTGIPMRNFKLYTGDAAAAAANVVRDAQTISDNYTQVAATAARTAVEAALENETPVLNLSAVEPKGNGYTLATAWTKNEDVALMDEETFAKADTYKATITLTPAEGMEFVDASKPDSIEIDGQEVALTADDVTINDAGNMVITVSFPSIESAQNELGDAITEQMAAAAATNNTANDRPIYTTDTWNDFKQAYDNAVALTGDNADLTDVSAADLAAAKAELVAAYAALEEADLGDQTNVAVYLPASALTGSADSIATEGEGDNGAPEKAVDGDKDSYWHTNWMTATDDNPFATYANNQLTGNNNFYIELDKAYTVSGLRYLPRPSYDPSSGTINNGAILKCNIYVATQKDEDGEWDWTLVSENKEWAAYPGGQTDYTVFRRYAEFDAVDGVQAVRIEAINTAGPQPNMFVNAAEIDILAVDALYENENGEALELLDAINADEIKAVVTAGNADGRWSTESWNAFVEKYNDAVEVFRDLHDESVKNEDGSVNAAVFTTAATEMRTAFDALEAPCLCTVTINSISVQDVTGNVLALGDDTSKEYTLVADVTVASNDCTHEGHTDGRAATVTFTATGATVSGSKLTVSNTATNVRITATATCDGITSEAKTADYTVTSNKAKNDLSAKIDDAAKIEQGDKTDEAYAALRAAIADAQKVLDNEDATDAERKAATTALANAITTFNNSSVPTPGDDTAKEELYNKLFALLSDSDAKTKSGLYTVESVNALVPVHNAAAATFNKANVDGVLHLENVELDELQKAYDDLTAALAKLVTKEAQAAAELAAAKADVNKALASAKVIIDAGQGTYTDATWTPFKAAYDAAVAGVANSSITTAQLKTLLATLTSTQAALAKATTTTPAPGTIVAGQTAELTSGRYQVINAAKKTAKLVQAKNKTKASITIPAQVTINGVKCKVVQVGPKAFKGFKKLKKITLTKNITTIGKQAFYGCTKLSSVVVKGTALKTIKTGAFKKTAKKMTVTFKSKKVKAAKRKALLKKMKKAGMSASAKLK